MLVGYQPTENFNIYGGAVYQTVEGNVQLRGLAYGCTTDLGQYNAIMDDASAVGWLAGIAYQIPEIALYPQLSKCILKPLLFLCFTEQATLALYTNLHRDIIIGCIRIRIIFYWLGILAIASVVICIAASRYNQYQNKYGCKPNQFFNHLFASPFMNVDSLIGIQLNASALVYQGRMFHFFELA
ncbi:hypothetical protein ACS72_00145 [Acinetobacter sp. VT 511]|nr:hypothetical protein ACS72_00145 [Acinetobacter sp. VT 511]